MFSISDKVVCIDDSPGRFNGLKVLKSGTVYVVEEIGRSPSPCGELGLVLVGIPATFDPLGCKRGWAAHRFRKLSEVQEENRAKRESEVTQEAVS